ncbi:MAG: hypothetical protein VX938_06440, partial [Myxococcota bacterium]|nr:hypothetical protein [Myxococcota bacterium]
MPRPLALALALMILPALPACGVSSDEASDEAPDASPLLSTASDTQGASRGAGDNSASPTGPAEEVSLSDVATMDATPANDALDAQSADAVADASPPDGEAVETAPQAPEETELKAVITAPDSGTLIQEGGSVTFIGVVTDSFYEPEQLEVTWARGDGELIETTTPGIGGWTQIEVDFETPGTESVVL